MTMIHRSSSKLLLLSTWLSFCAVRTNFHIFPLTSAFQPLDLVIATRAAPSQDNEPKYWNDVSEPVRCTRRSFVTESIACGVMSGFILRSRPKDLVAGADTGAEVRGTPVNAFNGLAFQYRGSDFNGLTASDIDEPSISYSEFVSKLKSGEVLSVEFYAPDGDVAYATLKSNSNNNNNNGNRIRIGEGYPIEQHDGYSSPAFAIRTVKNANVPYKFVVPALAKSKQ